MKKDIFISHAWGYDNLKRDNHMRCKKLCDMLILRGYNIWFDHYDMRGNIDRSIVNGINKCAIVIICFTNKYYNKIKDADNQQLLNDNCYKEWKYSIYKNKKIIPIIMEPDMKYYYLNDNSIIQMHLNNIMYIDMTRSLNVNLVKLFAMLSEFNVYSNPTPYTKPISTPKLISNFNYNFNFNFKLGLRLKPNISFLSFKNLLYNKIHTKNTTIKNNDNKFEYESYTYIDSNKIRESIRL